MTAETAVRKCIACAKPIRGRTDKKFCDDACRNTYNNQLKAPDNNFIRNINNTLRRNRRILMDLLAGQDKFARVQREKLIERGYKMKYFTHTYVNQKGEVYYFCYDHGFLPIDNNGCLLVKQKEKV